MLRYLCRKISVSTLRSLTYAVTFLISDNTFSQQSLFSSGIVLQWMQEPKSHCLISIGFMGPITMSCNFIINRFFLPTAWKRAILADFDFKVSKALHTGIWYYDSSSLIYVQTESLMMFLLPVTEIMWLGSVQVIMTTFNVSLVRKRTHGEHVTCYLYHKIGALWCNSLHSQTLTVVLTAVLTAVMYNMKYSSCLSKPHSEPMKYRKACPWLCFTWKEVLFLALIKIIGTKIPATVSL